MPLVLNMPGLRVWQGCEYARVTQGADMSKFWMSHSVQLLYKLLSNHRDRYSEHCQTFKIERSRNFSRHFDKHFVKNKKKRPRRVTFFKIFSWVLFKLHFWFLVPRLWVRLNIHQYAWICLNILENVWINCSDYARALNMHNHLTLLTGF